jgi:hypothetical protein
MSSSFPHLSLPRPTVVVVVVADSVDEQICLQSPSDKDKNKFFSILVLAIRRTSSAPSVNATSLALDQTADKPTTPVET